MNWYRKLLSLAACVVCTASLNSCKAQNDENVKVINPTEFCIKLAEDKTAFLLDVRRPDEFAEGHLKGAKLLNWLDAENFKVRAKELDKAKTIYVYCRSGRRSNEAANYLATQGYKVVDMKGGIIAWKEAELEIVTE